MYPIAKTMPGKATAASKKKSTNFLDLDGLIDVRTFDAIAAKPTAKVAVMSDI